MGDPTVASAIPHIIRISTVSCESVDGGRNTSHEVADVTAGQAHVGAIVVTLLLRLHYGSQAGNCTVVKSV